MEAFNAKLQQELQGTAWAAGCGSWYRNEAGRIINNWAGFATAYAHHTRQPDWTAFHQEKRPVSLAAAG
jgi:hypothetical protein